MEKHRLSRREFLETCGKGLFCLALTSSPLLVKGEAYPAAKTRVESAWGLVETKLSPYFRPLAENEVQCQLCPRTCVISSGERGYCEVRENRKGKLYSLVYGNRTNWSGGGIDVSASEVGENNVTRAVVINSTITDNVADAEDAGEETGGGIHVYAYGGTGAIASLDLYNTIVYATLLVVRTFRTCTLEKGGAEPPQ